MAMRTQQEAERAEQQRIKALVLNYDLRSGGGEAEEDDGLPTNGDYNDFSYISSTSTSVPPNPNHLRRSRSRRRNDDTTIYTKSDNE